MRYSGVSEKKKVTIKQVQCLTGLLNFLNKCIVPGRAFTHRMYSKLRITNAKGDKLKHYHHVSVDREFKLDLTVWLTFLQNASSRCLCRPFLDWSNCFVTATQLEFFTDASKALMKGFGCVFGNSYTWGQWEPGYIQKYNPSIEYLELFCPVHWHIYMEKSPHQLQNSYILRQSSSSRDGEQYHIFM